MDVEFLRYQFQDGFSGVVTKYGFSIGVRHLQMAYMFASAVVMGVVRGALPIAVLAITERTEANTAIPIHNWDLRMQGAILSSFFFGYAVLLVPLELHIHRLSGKYLITAMLAVNGMLTTAMPTIANRGGWVAVCNAMLLVGAAHAGFGAANQRLLDHWLPPSEKKAFGFIVFGGLQLGIVIGLPVSSVLSMQRLGWELIFYTLGMMSISMAIVYGILTASTPDQHQAIGDKEKEFIREALMCYSKKHVSTPWRHMLKSPQFWAVAAAHVASNAVFIFHLTAVPATLRCWYPLEYVGKLALIPFIATWLTYVLTAPTLGWISNLTLVSYILNVTNFRKLINFVGSTGVVIGLVLSSFERSVLFHTLTLSSLGFQFSGFLSSYKDMSENHAGTLMMVGAAVSSVGAATVPCLCGLLIPHPALPTVRDWRLVHLYLACTYIVCNVVYTMLGSNTRQHWDKHANKFTGHYNDIMDPNHVHMDELHSSSAVSEKPELDTAC